MSTDSWDSSNVTVSGVDFRIASRPGVPWHRAAVPTLELFCRHLPDGAVGTALALETHPAVAMTLRERAQRVVVTSRNLSAVRAIEQTLAWNDAKDIEAVASDGTHALRLPEPVDLVTIGLPRSRAARDQLVHDAWQALRDGGRLVMSGATKEGVKSGQRFVGDVFGAVAVCGVGRGGRVVEAAKDAAAPPRPEHFSHRCDHERFHSFEAKIGGLTLNVRSRPGVFSWDELDEGTAALAHAFLAVEPRRLGQDILDLGCGTGILAACAARHVSTAAVTAIDVDVTAARCAEATARANGCGNVRVEVGDGTEPQAPRADTVLMNVPFHTGRRVDESLPEALIRSARQMLRPRGTLWMVANRQRPYESIVDELFGRRRTVSESSGFKVIVAHPRR